MSKLGSHVVQGSRNGYGPFCTAKPAVIIAHGEGGALVEAWSNSNHHTITIFRHTFYKDAPENIDRMTSAQARALADEHYPTFKAKWGQNPADYYAVLNEPAGNDLSVLPAYLAYELRFMELAEVDDYKLCVLNLAGGTPGNIDHWKTHYVPHIKRAFDGGHIYGRHAYGGGLLATPDGNSNRPFIEAEYLRSLGLTGGIVITEAGQNGGYGFIGIEAFNTDVQAYNALMMQHSNIVGACLWTLGDWGQPNANWQDSLPSLTNWIANNPTPKWEPTTPEPPVPTPSVKVVIVKKPAKSEITKAENDSANDYAWTNYGRTSTHSVDDMIRMLSGGNADSYCVLAYPDKPSQEDAKLALGAGKYNWVEWPESVPANPLDGLRLGHILPYRYMLTSAFDAPRSYGKHEGCDYDVIGGQPDNKVNVLCAYDGIVDISLDKTTGYGKHIRVKHVRNGSPFYTRYAHLDARFVNVGQSVMKGTALGEIGATGNADGEHVHLNLEVPEYGLSGYVTAWVVNPEPYMALGRNTLPNIPAQTGLDMSKYFLPKSGSYGQLFMLKNNWGAGDERCQLQSDPNVSYVTKNQAYEQRVIDNSYIDLKMDTSPGNGEYYTVTGHWLPRYMSPSQVFTRSETITFRYKSNCQPVPSKPTYTATTTITFDKHHSNWTCPESNITLQDVIELSWFAGGRVDERYWFANGLGLVRWEKYSGQKSWIHELVPVGTQGNNVKEIGCFS